MANALKRKGDVDQISIAPKVIIATMAYALKRVQGVVRLTLIVPRDIIARMANVLKRMEKMEEMEEMEELAGNINGAQKFRHCLPVSFKEQTCFLTDPSV